MLPSNRPDWLSCNVTTRIRLPTVLGEWSRNMICSRTQNYMHCNNNYAQLDRTVNDILLADIFHLGLQLFCSCSLLQFTTRTD